MHICDYVGSVVDKRSMAGLYVLERKLGDMEE